MIPGKASFHSLICRSRGFGHLLDSYRDRVVSCTVPRARGLDHARLRATSTSACFLYVKSLLITIRFNSRWSVCFLITMWPNVLTGLKAVRMWNVLWTRPTRSDAPLTCERTASPSGLSCACLALFLFLRHVFNRTSGYPFAFRSAITRSCSLVLSSECEGSRLALFRSVLIALVLCVTSGCATQKQGTCQFL